MELLNALTSSIIVAKAAEQLGNAFCRYGDGTFTRAKRKNLGRKTPSRLRKKITNSAIR